MEWRTSDGRITVTVIRLDTGPAYRITSYPGRYYGGDYRSMPQLARALADFGVDLADLQPTSLS